MVLGFTSGLRDWLIILWAFLSVLALVAVIAATFSIWSGVRGLIKTVKTSVNEDIQPILTIGQDSAQNVAGTARFFSDAAVKPVITGLSYVAGARRAISVFTGLAGRGGGGKSKGRGEQRR